MGYYDFPHSRNYDTDLGYLIKQYLILKERVNNYIAYQSITYADPLQWSIDKQYKTNTIVIDGYNAYLSKKPVPLGIEITNTEYWLLIGDFIRELDKYIKVFNNVADMKADTTLTTGVLVTTNGYYSINDMGGAAYYIVSEKPNEYHEVLNNGLYAKIIIDRNIVPEMFGAKADNKTDDLIALQNAINFCGEVGVTLYLNKKDYKTSNTLNIPYNDFQMSGIQDCEFLPNVAFMDSETTTNKILFNVTGWGCHFSKFIARGAFPLSNYGIGFVFDATNNNGNIDAELEDMRITYLNYGIKTYGRNIKIHNCTFEIIENAIELNEYTSDSPLYRGYDISNNRIHDSSFFIINNITNANRVMSLYIVNNYIDSNANSLYLGYGNGVYIANNLIKDFKSHPTNCISITGFNPNKIPCTIIDNFFDGSSIDGTIFARTCLSVDSADNSYVNFSNNTITNFSGTNISITNNTSIVNISNNYFIMPSNNVAITVNNGNKGKVSNNLISSSEALSTLISVPSNNFTNTENVVYSL